MRENFNLCSSKSFHDHPFFRAAPHQSRRVASTLAIQEHRVSADYTSIQSLESENGAL
jgi:hypothetical protein